MPRRTRLSSTAALSALVFAIPSIYAATQPRALTTSPTEFISQPYDYVIVGGGTAGLVVAARLSEDPNTRVGVLEAGGYVQPGSDPRIDLVTSYSIVFGNPDFDWLLKTVPQEGLSGRVVDETVARVLGGSSMISDVLWQRASREEYDAWGTALGNGPSWSFDGLEPYFRKAENWTAPPSVILPGAPADPQGLLQCHGQEGPVQVSYNTFYPGVIAPSVAAANVLGIKSNANPDTGDASGFATPARAVDPQTGMRSSALTAYFEPNANRPNLKVLIGAQATKVAFSTKTKKGEAKVAESVDFVVGGTTYTVKAKKEVILAAGTMKTPQLLELSGVGDKTLLKKFGIETIIDLPGVGENLLDQTYTLIDYTLKPGVPSLDDFRNNPTFMAEQQALFAASQTGALTYDTAATGSTSLQSFLSSQNITSLSALIPKSSDSSLSPLQKAQYELMSEIFSGGETGWVEFLVLASGGAASVPAPDTSYATPIVFHLYPYSRGYVHIKSNDPLAAPTIDPRYFSNEFDVTTHALTTAWMRKWMETEPIASLIDKPNAPSPKDTSTLDEWKAYVRSNAVSTFHPIGTAALAPESLHGVVAPDFKVHHAANLRVVDASIIPMTFSVAPLATVFAIAEKAADVIKSQAASPSSGSHRQEL
ncbi:alcohol oxidase [Artomyces pyxidatus]|uniref:Alcohol oxidase n=1 Tax=Artomyces pyxidatus TaxID=48021 RepID=A0ACB8T4A1_9AGAM|nr:alcohol oxidase [Artomyces pyxidatus]